MKKYLIILLLLTLVGFFLRAYPFEAKSWVMDYDTEIVRQSLDLGQGILNRDFSSLTKPTLYPYLTSYCLLFAYGIFYLLGRFLGLFFSTGAFIGYIFFHLNEFYWYSRILTAIFGSLIIPLIYLVVIKLFKGGSRKKVILGSLLAAFLYTFSLLCLQFSQQIRPHIVVSFFFLLSFYLYLRCLEKKTLRSFAFLGISAGLAAGSLQTGFLSFIFIILANYFVVKDDVDYQHWFSWLKIFFSKQFLTGFLSFLAILLILYPYVFFNPRSTLIVGDKFDFTLSGGRHFDKTFSLLSQGFGGRVFLKGFLFNELSLFLLLIIFSIIYLFYWKRKSFASAQSEQCRQKSQRFLIKPSQYYQQAWAGWWIFVGLYSIFLVLCGNIPRYRLLCPLIPFLCVATGVLFINIFNQLVGYRQLFSFLIISLLLFEFIQAIRLVQLMQRPYTRDQAVDWIKKNISSSEPILFQAIFPNLISTKESVKVQAMLRDGVLSRQNQFSLSLDNLEYFENSKTIIDSKSVVEYKGGNAIEAREFIKKIEPIYLILSSRSLVSEKEGNCFECQMAQEYGQLVKSFTPFKNNQTKRELTFPSGMLNPLVDLWVSRQLGPTIEIYKMNWSND